MYRKYLFKWYETKTGKYRKEPLYRTTQIVFENAIGNVNIDCKKAVTLFTQLYGNLNKINIVWIKELDKDGNQIGEDITPSEENQIIPIEKKNKPA